MKKRGMIFAILAAALYALSTPFSKLLMNGIPPTLLASLLYLGAGGGMLLVRMFYKNSGEQKLVKKDLPYVIGMILLDIAAPICLLFGLLYSNAANVALLNNFEIAATALIALILFHESIPKRLWLGIIFVTTACTLLSFESLESLHFSSGSLLVLLACLCWGLENNCTRKLSEKDPLQIVVVKGLGSGTGSLILSLIQKEQISKVSYLLPALFLGFAAYGLSIFFYIYAQRYLGAAKTSTFYAIAPFLSATGALLLFRKLPDEGFLIAALLMAIGTYLSATEGRKKKKTTLGIN